MIGDLIELTLLFLGALVVWTLAAFGLWTLGYRVVKGYWWWSPENRWWEDDDAE